MTDNIRFDEASTVRFDEFDIRMDSVTRTKQGYLKLGGYNAGTGILTYHNADGTTTKELRTIKELQASMESMDGLPVTAGHPVEVINGKPQQVLLDQNNTAKHQKGYYIGNPSIKDGLGFAQRVITDPVLDSEITTGLRRQISLGYNRDFILGPHPDYPDGTFDGVAYDGYQTNIEWNHEAIVNLARGGPRLRVVMDSKAMFDSIDSQIDTNKEEVKKMPTFRVDSTDYEVSEGLKVALDYRFKADEKEKEKLQNATDNAIKAATAMEAKFDEAQSALAALKAVDIDAKVAALVALQNQAKPLLPANFVFDGLDEFAIKKAVVETQRPNIDLSKKADAKTYVDVCFDGIIDSVPANVQGSPAAYNSPQYWEALKTFQPAVRMDSADDGDPLGKKLAEREARNQAAYKGAHN